MTSAPSETKSGLVVNTTIDGTSVPAGDMSLRDAVNLANDLTGSPEITFASSIFAAPQTITLTQGGFFLTNTSASETITGPAAGVTISGGGSTFHVDQGVTATLSDLKITNSQVTQDGGGIFVSATARLTVNDCTISGNSAGKNGGGLCNEGTTSLSGCTISGNAVSVGYGGGLYNSTTGNLTVSDCTLAGNSASGGGAVDNDGMATLTGCTFTGNSSLGGGGLENSAKATLTDCTLSGNTAVGGGGFVNYSAGVLSVVACTISDNSGNKGGGLFSDGKSVTLTDTIVADNTLHNSASPSDILGSVSGTYNLIGTGDAGGLTNGTGHNIVLTSLTNLDLAPLGFYGGPTETMALLPGGAGIGKGSASVSGVTIPSSDERGFTLSSQVNIGAFQSTHGLVVNTTLDGTTTTSGDMSLRQSLALASVVPGASQITFDSTVFAAPQVITLTAGPLELSDTSGAETITAPATGLTISGGGASGVFQVESGVTATLSGLTITDGSASPYGGGVFNQGSTTLTDCTISDNTAGAAGGGLENRGKLLSLVACTISGNSAKYAGGGLNNYAGATLKMVACTVSGNSAGSGGGGLSNYYGSATLTDTIVAGNTVTGGTIPLDIAGTVSGTYNLIGSGGAGGLSSGGSNRNIILSGTVSPGLAALGADGGPTQTMALLPGSAAFGAGAPVSGITTDQRGDKLDTPDPDIGAYQSLGFTVAVAGGSNQSTQIDTAFPRPLKVTVKANDPKEPVAGGVISFHSPSSGASATLSDGSATIGSNGEASVTATANSSTGNYTIAASVGADGPADFQLSNTKATSKVVVTQQSIENKKHHPTSVELVAQFEPPAPGGAVPTGTVTFELASSKKKKPKVLGKAVLHGGTATLRVARNLVLNKVVTVLYKGDADFLAS